MDAFLVYLYSNDYMAVFIIKNILCLSKIQITWHPIFYLETAFGTASIQYANLETWDQNSFIPEIWRLYRPGQGVMAGVCSLCAEHCALLLRF